MTGFGKAEVQLENKTVSIELRSLNSKSLDLNMRAIPLYREIELENRSIVAELLDRGKVELSISLENSGETKNYAINRDLAQAYYNDIKETAAVLGIEAARQTIFNEISEVIEFDNTYINYHHLSLLVDRMTCNKKMVSIFRHGLNSDNVGPIAKASFEETPQMFMKAAQHGELDPVRGLSANVMCGQEGRFGTAAFSRRGFSSKLSSALGLCRASASAAVFWLAALTPATCSCALCSARAARACAPQRGPLL